MGGGGVFGGFGDNNGGYAQAMQRNQAQYGQNHPKYRTKACKYFQGPGGCKNGARRALCFHISAGARPSTRRAKPLLSSRAPPYSHAAAHPQATTARSCTSRKEMMARSSLLRAIGRPSSRQACRGTAAGEA